MKKNTGREVLKKLKENGYLHEEEKEIIDEIYKKNQRRIRR